MRESHVKVNGQQHDHEEDDEEDHHDQDAAFPTLEANSSIETQTPSEPQPHHRPTLNLLSILSLVTFFSIWGTLTREGLVALNTYHGSSIKPLIWAQAVGCLVMGWAIGNQKAIEKRFPPLYTGITVGYCGSVTTFSSWMLEVFQAFGDQQHFNRGGLHNVMDALTQTAATLGMSLISLQAGIALSDFLKFETMLLILNPTKWFRLSNLPENQAKASRRETGAEEEIASSKRQTAREGDSGSASRPPPRKFSSEHVSNFYSILFVIFLGPIFWIASAFLCGFKPSFRPTTFAVVFSPPGAVLRWYLSRFNNSPRSKERFPFWPLGTLSANLLATAIISVLFLCQNYGGSGLGVIASTRLTCHVLYGLQEGFCGCLSTVSTFAVELTKLRPKRKAVGFAVGSWFFGVLICILIIGIPWWTRGMDGSCVGITL